MLTKQEAYQAMKEGHKVSHKYFRDEEYIRMFNNKMFDERNHPFEREFENIRYDNGWRIWVDPK